MAMEEPPQSGPNEALSESVSVSVSDPPKEEKKEEPKLCPECDTETLFKVDDRHWTCTNCNCQTTFLIQKEI